MKRLDFQGFLGNSLDDLAFLPYLPCDGTEELLPIVGDVLDPSKPAAKGTHHGDSCWVAVLSLDGNAQLAQVEEEIRPPTSACQARDGQQTRTDRSEAAERCHLLYPLLRTSHGCCQRQFNLKGNVVN